MARRRGSISRAAPARPTRSVAPAKPAAPAPAAAAPQPVVIQGPGMLSNIASTAAGVALGHTAAHALTGAFSGRSEPVEAQATAAAAPVAAAPMNQTQQTPCLNEMQQFLHCSQQQSDLSLCEGFNQVLKECRMRYSTPNGF